MNTTVYRARLSADLPGTYQEFTVVGTADHGSAVQFSDNESVGTSTPGLSETFRYSNDAAGISTGTVVPADAVISLVSLTLAPQLVLRQLLKSGASELTAGSAATGYEDIVVGSISSSILLYTTNPFTSAAWVTADIFAIEYGARYTRPEVQAVTIDLFRLTVQWDASIALTITPTELPQGVVGRTYDQLLTGHGGDGGPYTFEVLSGTLPPGIVLYDYGLLLGTITE